MTQENPQATTFADRLDQWQEIVWLLIACVTPLFVNLWVEQQFEASKVWLLRLLVFLLVGLFVVKGSVWGGRNRSNTLHPTIRTLIAALFLVFALSTLQSGNRYIATFGNLERANGLVTQICYLFLFVVVAVRLDDARSQRLVQVIIFTSLPIGLFGLAQAAGWQPFAITTDARTTLATTLGRANFTGAYLALLLPLTLGAARSAQAHRIRLGYGALFLLQVTVIVLTQARAAAIAALVGVGVLVWLWVALRWSRMWRRLTLLCGGMAVVTLLMFLLQRGIASGGSIAARWTIWQASLRLLWPRMWLGYGADTLDLSFPAVYPPQLVYYQGRDVVVDRAHNWLLDWSLSHGVVATTLFVALVAFVLYRGWLQREQPLVPACIAAICAHLVGNLFLFEVAATAVVFWLLMAVVVAASGVGEPKSLTLPISRRWLPLCVAVLIGLLAWLSWQVSVRPLLADAASWRATRALGDGTPTRALAGYREAVAWQPRRAEYYVAAGLTEAQVGEFASADLTLRTAIALRPTDPKLYNHLAAIYAAWSPERLDNAYAAYEQAIALAPTIAHTYQRYADTALRAGDAQLAIEQAKHAVELDATNGVAFGILGWAQLQIGDPQAAQSAFEQAVRWVGDSADFHLGLATAHYQQGNIAAARTALNESLTLSQTYQPALELQSLLDQGEN